MICQFSFRNYKSYRKETTFDFQAAAIPEFAESLLTCKAENKDNKIVTGSVLLPVGVVYGPNGGGKSNLLRALSFLITTVVKPINDLQKTRRSVIIQQAVDYEPFMLDDESRKEPSVFEIFFCQGKNEYNYQLALLNGEIVSEYLYWRAIGGKRTGTVFERESSVITLGPSVSKSGINTSVNPKMPYLSFLAINYDIPVIAEVQSWFESCIIRDYSNPAVDRVVMLSQNDDVKTKIIQALNDMGIDLSGYRFDDDEKELYTRRMVKGKEYELRFADESDGTKELIAALPVLILALQEGRLVIVDELDAKLHPKLLRYIISMFRNSKLNIHGAQLLYTSHDMTTMKNTVFRRDEIWFAAENAEHESEIYSLYDIRREDNERVNSTAAFDKQYMEGRYGADPYLTNMLSEGEWP